MTAPPLPQRKLIVLICPSGLFLATSMQFGQSASSPDQLIFDPGPGTVAGSPCVMHFLRYSCAFLQLSSLPTNLNSSELRNVESNNGFKKCWFIMKPPLKSKFSQRWESLYYIRFWFESQCGLCLEQGYKKETLRPSLVWWARRDLNPHDIAATRFWV